MANTPVTAFPNGPLLVEQQESQGEPSQVDPVIDDVDIVPLVPGSPCNTLNQNPLPGLLSSYQNW